MNFLCSLGVFHVNNDLEANLPPLNTLYKRNLLLFSCARDLGTLLNYGHNCALYWPSGHSYRYGTTIRPLVNVRCPGATSLLVEPFFSPFY